MKKLMKMNKIYLTLILASLFSCKKQEMVYPTPCNGDCQTYYEVSTSGAYLGNDGYWRVPFNGSHYFQIKGDITPLRDQYVINGEPLTNAKFDSDYWVVFDTLTFQTPMYSYLGWFNDDGLTNPIPIGNYTITLTNLIETHPPLNVVGYQIPKDLCVECPYSETILGTHSKYTYNPTLNVFVDNEMIGDTINVFIETVFNTDVGRSETVLNNLKIIIQ